MRVAVGIEAEQPVERSDVGGHVERSRSSSEGCVGEGGRRAKEGGNGISILVVVNVMTAPFIPCSGLAGQLLQYLIRISVQLMDSEM